MNEKIFSCIIPAKSLDDSLLKDLLSSIRAQDFPQDKIETIVVTEGDSEQAKAIGIRKAKGEICAMFCADNLITDNDLFKRVKFNIDSGYDACFTRWYAYVKKDNSLNRYFSLIGGNDPVCYYLGKNDREPHVWELLERSNYQPSYGCNGTFYRSELIKKTDLDHYYPMDNAMEIELDGGFCPLESSAIWHRTTDGNLIKFLIKRYKYARDLYCDRRDRRWKMLDTKEDYFRLFLFVLFTVTIIQPLCISIYGIIRIRDRAWLWHPIVCWGFLITYGILVCRNFLKYLSSFLRLAVKNVLKNALSPLTNKPTKTTR